MASRLKCGRFEVAVIGPRSRQQRCSRALHTRTSIVALAESPRSLSRPVQFSFGIIGLIDHTPIGAERPNLFRAPLRARWPSCVRSPAYPPFLLLHRLVRSQRTMFAAGTGAGARGRMTTLSGYRPLYVSIRNSNR